MTDERKAFEAWAIANEMAASGDRLDRLDYPLGRCLWKAWQAATAAERERCAAICESRQTPGTGSVAILNGAADAIRKG